MGGLGSVGSLFAWKWGPLWFILTESVLSCLQRGWSSEEGSGFALESDHSEKLFSFWYIFRWPKFDIIFGFFFFFFFCSCSIQSHELHVRADALPAIFLGKTSSAVPLSFCKCTYQPHAFLLTSWRAWTSGCPKMVKTSTPYTLQCPSLNKHHVHHYRPLLTWGFQESPGQTLSFKRNLDNQQVKVASARGSWWQRVFVSVWLMEQKERATSCVFGWFLHIT